MAQCQHPDRGGVATDLHRFIYQPQYQRPPRHQKRLYQNFKVIRAHFDIFVPTRGSVTDSSLNHFPVKSSSLSRSVLGEGKQLVWLDVINKPLTGRISKKAIKEHAIKNDYPLQNPFSTTQKYVRKVNKHVKFSAPQNSHNSIDPLPPDVTICTPTR